MTAQLDAPRRRSAPAARQRRGRRAEHWGRAAETAVEAAYRARGGRILARRVRNAAGEIDLVVGLGALTVFVEVKARATLAAALGAVTDWPRLFGAAEAYAAERGVAGDMRFDLAAMDRAGQLALVENASMTTGF